MKNTPGSFIVLDGYDTQLVNRQLDLLSKTLASDGYTVAIFDTTAFEAENEYIKRLADGAYNHQSEINPYISTLVYSMQRFDIRKLLADTIMRYDVVLTAGFTGRQLVSEGRRLRSYEERRGFYLWVDTMEYQLMKLPRPAINFVLASSASKGSAKNAALNALRDIAALFPRDFRIIDCVRKKSTLPENQIHKLLYEQAVAYTKPLREKKEGSITSIRPKKNRQSSAKHILAEKRFSTADALTTLGQDNIEILPADPERVEFASPHNMPKDILEEYNQFVEQSSALYERLLNQPGKAKDRKLEDREIAYISQMALPMARLRLIRHASAAVPPGNPLLELQARLKNTPYTSDFDDIKLLHAHPHNELNALAMQAFTETDLSGSELQQQLESWEYLERVALFKSGLFSGEALRHLIYSFELLLPACLLLELFGELPGARWQIQRLTPRFGYDTPTFIEEAGLSDELDDLYDRSFRLYSELAEANLKKDARLVLLYGHKVRCVTTVSAIDILNATRVATLPQVSSILKKMAHGLSAVHPIVAEILDNKSMSNV